LTSGCGPGVRQTFDLGALFIGKCSDTDSHA